jgi:hypothetical protein
MPDEALWDCNQTLEIRPDDIKALYRRAKVRVALLKKELDKEDRGEFWIVDKGKALLSDAKQDLCLCDSHTRNQNSSAVGDGTTGGGEDDSNQPQGGNNADDTQADAEGRQSSSEPTLSSLTDPACVKLGRELRVLEARLRECDKAYLEQQKHLFRDRMFKGLSCVNGKTQDAAREAVEANQRQLEQAALDDLPELDE